MSSANPAHTSDTLRVGYLLRMYPRFSQTFVVNEIRELERQGIDVRIASLRLPNEGMFHESVTKVRATCDYLEDKFVGSVKSHLSAQWRLFRKSPRMYASLLRLKRRHPGIRWFELCQAASLLRWARKAGVGHVHVHFGTDEANVAMFAHWLGGLSYSLTLHAFDIFRDNVDRRLLAEKINRSRFTVTVCESNRDFIVKNLPGVDPRKVVVHYNGIDLAEFSPTASSRRPFSIFSVGRLIEKKGFVHLVRAVAMLRESGLPVVLQIAGEGGDEARIRREVKDRGLEKNVQLLGSLRQDEVRTRMQESACFALACIQAKDGNVDALPTVLLESLACGCPSVSTRISGVPEILDDGESGLLVEPEDDEALAEAMRRVLTDAELAARLSLQGRCRAELRFDSRTNVAGLRARFQAAMGVSTLVADGHGKTADPKKDESSLANPARQEAA